MTPLDHSRLRAEVVRIAESNIGYGEHNSRFLTAIGSPAHYDWCAIFASYPYRTASLNLKLPTPLWCYRRPNVPEPGAKRLVKQLGAVGSMWKPSACDVTQPRIGDLVAWNRGILGWTGHVGIVVELKPFGFKSIEGNVGGKVVLKSHSWNEPKLWRFASIER